jgi:hypothetical protein
VLHCKVQFIVFISDPTFCSSLDRQAALWFVVLVVIVVFVVIVVIVAIVAFVVLWSLWFVVFVVLWCLWRGIVVVLCDCGDLVMWCCGDVIERLWRLRRLWRLW